MILVRTLATLLLAASSLLAHAAVDVNRASRAELETVPGVGPSLSGKILEARKAGDFKNWTDLVDRVSGIGPGNAARLSKAGLTVGKEAFDPASGGTPIKARAARKTDGAASAPGVGGERKAKVAKAEGTVAAGR